MKIWVPSDRPLIRTENEPLKNICATADDKRNFFGKNFQKLLLVRIAFDSNEFEHLFVDYASGENAAWAGLSNSPNEPGPTFIKSDARRDGLANSRQDFGQSLSETFALNAPARAPDASAAKFFHARRNFRSIDLSSRARPRAPPVLI